MLSAGTSVEESDPNSYLWGNTADEDIVAESIIPISLQFVGFVGITCHLHSRFLLLVSMHGKHANTLAADPSANR